MLNDLLIEIGKVKKKLKYLILTLFKSNFLLL